MPIGCVTAESGAAVHFYVALSTVPAGFRLPQLSVDGSFLVGAGLG